MAKISVLADVHILDEAKERIQELSSEPVDFPTGQTDSIDELVARTNNAEIVLVSPRTKINNEYLDRCPSVKYVGVCGTSITNLDTQLLEQRNITYTNVKDYGDEPTAEFIFMQLVSLLRGIGDYQWKPEPHELMGKTITIIGLGALGQTVAELALAYKMHIQYHSRSRKKDWENKGLVYGQLNDIIANSDIVVLTVSTDTLVMSIEQFGLLKQGTILLQASIGNVVDEQAFRQRIAAESNFAIFDYAAGDSLYLAYKDLDRVIFPKIVAGHTIETKQRLGERVVGNINGYLLSS